MDSDPFELVAMSMESDAQLAAIIAVGQGADADQIQRFARALAGAPLSAEDLIDVAAAGASIDGALLRSLVSKQQPALSEQGT